MEYARDLNTFFFFLDILSYTPKAVFLIKFIRDCITIDQSIQILRIKFKFNAKRTTDNRYVYR